MHKLDRNSVAKPTCLDCYDHQHHSWNDISSSHKKETRESLIQLQGERCAYCEGPTYNKGHIEHFRRKNPAHYPHLIFDWSNLFLSCDSSEHCGHYKDGPRSDYYDPNDLIKPDEHDPHDLLYYHSYGDVRPQSSASSSNDMVRAKETIRVFNLNCGILQALRRRVLKDYEKDEILDELRQWNDEDRREFITKEIASTEQQPYSTVIRHFFQKVI